MKGSSLPATLIFLMVGGALAILPASEEVTRLGHLIQWTIETAWFLWENL